jgi:hypothetical protein
LLGHNFRERFSIALQLDFKVGLASIPIGRLIDGRTDIFLADFFVFSDKDQLFGAMVKSFASVFVSSAVLL